MRDAMTHRGPDDMGIFMDDVLGLGFRRLSIIDLDTGHQPMLNEDGSIVVIFNGEIYNYRDLRKELIGKNHIFRTKSDTEVIVHLYEELGESFVDRLNGMFAIALWDRRKRKLVLARDRVGEKPLYYVQAGKNLYFASEIKAFLRIAEIPKVLRKELLPEFLSFGNIYGEKTLLKGIFELLPGHILVCDDNGLKVSQYWDERYVAIDETPEDESKASLEALLTESVEMRLMSDVPLGAFLSGGVDSSLTVALMSKMLGSPVQSFSIGFEAKGFSELGYARRVADLFHTDHHEVTLRGEQCFDALPRLVYFQDEPINHPSAVQLHLLACYAKRRGVTVLLSGEGGDELFAGYSSYVAMLRDIRLRKLLPRWVWKGMSDQCARLHVRKYSKIFERYAGSVESLILGTQNLVSRRDLARLLPGESPESEFFLNQLERPEHSALSRVLYAHLKTRLVSLLMKQDKMTMAASLEVRVPFLDHRIIRLAASMPDHLKICNGERKYIVKRLAEKYLPRDIIYRQKVGFPVPIATWFQGDNKYIDLLREKRTVDRGFFDHRFIGEMLAAHKQGHYDYSSTIWNLINLEIWLRLFVDGEPLEQYPPIPLVEHDVPLKRSLFAKP